MLALSLILVDARKNDLAIVVELEALKLKLALQTPALKASLSPSGTLELRRGPWQRTGGADGARLVNNSMYQYPVQSQTYACAVHAVARKVRGAAIRQAGGMIAKRA